MARADADNNPQRTEITALLRQWHAGDSDALNRLLPQVYAELRQLAAAELRGKPGHTLQPTALVHEVFARLLSSEKLTSAIASICLPRPHA
ncbi:hypothetical protein HC761_00955 [bacterium]|nr:hypothetical protein [bacterium]